MEEKLRKCFHVVVTSLLVFQLSGCGTLLYPERKGQTGGRLDVGVVILDAIGLLFFLIPGIVAFAVDFNHGTIYLPAKKAVLSKADLKEIKFDPKHTSLAQIEQIIKDETGQTVKLTKGNVRISRLESKEEMMTQFAQSLPQSQDNRLALLR